ncbi:ABC transporter permease subunit [Chakrabartyella piscis]|uniref:ABC transporter permease subunit n=1 Tax=Chakrabartyella piscis TaxID=2918914 RepID=UPI002958C033|nr:ribose ABC transporter permease [Chakrabartyella piscis]
MRKSVSYYVEKYRPIIILVVFMIAISIMRPEFLQPSNLSNVLRQTSVNAIIAAGMSFAILTGGIDISVGSTLAFSGAVSAYMVLNNYNIIVVILVTLTIGVIAGAMNGLFITKFKLQPFIVTLATMTIFRGMTTVFTQGRPISFKSEGTGIMYRFIGKESLFGIPIPIIIMVVVYILGYYLLNHTSFGRYIYAIGCNEDAAHLSGINTKKVKFMAYVINGCLAALAAIIVTARLSSAQPTAGDGYELDAIAAVVLGGTSLAGGRGKITGTIIGAMIIGMLSNALNLMDVSSYYQTIIKGLVILVAVLLDREK